MVNKQVSNIGNCCLLEDMTALDEVDVVLVEDQRARQQTLEVQRIREELECRGKFLDRVLLLAVGEILHLARETIVDAERQAGHLLGDDHQRTGNVQRVRTVIIVLPVQMDAR